MKSLFIFLLLIFSFEGLTNNCGTFFSKGINNYSFATEYFQKGMDAYDEALEVNREEKPRYMVICRLLVESVGGFRVAADSYLNCEDSFEKAESSCTGEDRRNAENNKKICEKNKTISLQNHQSVENILEKNCFKNLEATKLDEVELLLRLSL